MKTPIRVAVTGAAGNIGYALLFRIANGDLFGPDQPVILQMLEITPAMKALEGVAMELDDCAFPLLTDLVLTDDANVAFKDVNWALLVGARPRTQGHGAQGPAQRQRRDLHRAGQGDQRQRRLGCARAGRRQPGQHQLPDRHAQRAGCAGRALHGHDTARPQPRHAQLANKAGVPVTAVKKVTIWGNHSATQYPDAFHAEINGQPAAKVIDDDAWIKETFIPTVQKRGAAIIEARGQSSAASAANAAINHVQTWYGGTPDGDWVSMAIPSTGAYGSAEGVIFSYPVTVKDGKYRSSKGWT